MRKLLIVLIVILSVVALVLAIIAGYIFFAGGSKGTPITLTNPVAGIIDDEAVEIFDEGFVEYLSYAIGAGELHNPPFSKDTPEIEFDVGGEIYNVEVVHGFIDVGVGAIEDEDILITTTKKETVKMLRDKNYIVGSFASGASEISLVASKTKLLAKGYLKIYTELTGEEIDAG
ncbi:MAG: hypothetical protein ABIG28_02695 [archaeon]